MCLFPDLYSAELCFRSSVLQKTVNNIYRFAYPFFLALSLQILKLCSLLSSGLQSTSELMTVLTLTTRDYFIRTQQYHSKIVIIALHLLGLMCSQSGGTTGYVNQLAYFGLRRL